MIGVLCIWKEKKEGQSREEGCCRVLCLGGPDLEAILSTYLKQEHAPGLFPSTVNLLTLQTG